MKVSQKRCLGTSIESYTGSSPSEQVTLICIFHFWNKVLRPVLLIVRAGRDKSKLICRVINMILGRTELGNYHYCILIEIRKEFFDLIG